MTSMPQHSLTRFYHVARLVENTAGRRRISPVFIVLPLLLLSLGIGGILHFRAFFIYQSYQQGQCMIQSGHVQKYSQRKSGSYYTPEFTYSVRTVDAKQASASGYDAPDRQHFSSLEAQKVVQSYTVGNTYTCWYNPSYPAHAALIYRGYALTSLLLNVASTTMISFTCLGLLAFILHYHVYFPILLMLRGVHTQGQVIGHLRKRSKGKSTAYSRILFQSHSFPYVRQEIEAKGEYPLNSWQPICYDPYHLKNAKQGGRPTGCGPALVFLLCLAAILAGDFLLLPLWAMP